MLSDNEIAGLTSCLSRAITERLPKFSTKKALKDKGTGLLVDFRIIESYLLPNPSSPAKCPGFENWIPLDLLVEKEIIQKDWTEKEFKTDTGIKPSDVYIEIKMDGAPCPEFFAVTGSNRIKMEVS